MKVKVRWYVDRFGGNYHKNEEKDTQNYNNLTFFKRVKVVAVEVVIKQLLRWK